MRITIFGAESLGVRGLSCSVELHDRKIFIDPGIALGWSRHGLHPHPFQVAVGARIRARIAAELTESTDVVFSHFHGDHCPLQEPNPYQLGIEEVRESLAACRIWAMDTSTASFQQQVRRSALVQSLGRDFGHVSGEREGPLEFSLPVPHGRQEGRQNGRKHGRKQGRQPGRQQSRHSNTVMMSRIADADTVFVHASDSQLLDRPTVDCIIEWQPDIVLVSGPPLYHYASSSFKPQRAAAWENACLLSKHVNTLIIDHHLLRSEEGVAWLKKLDEASPNTVQCAAEYMRQPPLYLEAWRGWLYEELPVPEGWHEDYRLGRVDTASYEARGREILEGMK